MVIEWPASQPAVVVVASVVAANDVISESTALATRAQRKNVDNRDCKAFCYIYICATVKRFDPICRLSIYPTTADQRSAFRIDISTIVVIFILIILAPKISGSHAENISAAVNQISYSSTQINDSHLLFGHRGKSEILVASQT